MIDDTHQRQNHVADIAYVSRRLSVYDMFLQFIPGAFWGCPTARVVAFYDQHISASHLDVGVGTGYFLDHCRFPVAKPRLMLIDSNRDPLEVTSRRLRRYAPSALQANIMDPIPFDGPRFDSVSMNYLIHCLPGTMRDKGKAFRNVKALMSEGAVVFGATVLGQEVEHNLPGSLWLAYFNRKGVLDNLRDTRADLTAMLNEHFSRSSVELVGRTALFAAWV